MYTRNQWSISLAQKIKTRKRKIRKRPYGGAKGSQLPNHSAYFVNAGSVGSKVRPSNAQSSHFATGSSFPCNGSRQTGKKRPENNCSYFAFDMVSELKILIYGREKTTLSDGANFIQLIFFCPSDIFLPIRGKLALRLFVGFELGGHKC